MIIFILFLIGIEKFFTFLKKDYFKVTKIKISGNYSIIEKGIVEHLKNLKGENLWMIDEKKLEEYISQDIRIKEIKITKSVPDTLKIYIEERKPFVYILFEGNIYYGDENGVIYSYREEIKNQKLITISIRNIEEVNKIYKIVKNIDEKIKGDISEVYIKENIYIVVLRDGIIFKTNESVEKTKYDIGYKLYLKLKEAGEKISYIDLRFDDYVVK